MDGCTNRVETFGTGHSSQKHALDRTSTPIESRRSNIAERRLLWWSYGAIDHQHSHAQKDSISHIGIGISVQQFGQRCCVDSRTIVETKHDTWCCFRECTVEFNSSKVHYLRSMDATSHGPIRCSRNALSRCWA